MSGSAPGFSILSNEHLVFVLQQLDPLDLARIVLVNKRLHALVEDPKLWATQRQRLGIPRKALENKNFKRILFDGCSALECIESGHATVTAQELLMTPEKSGRSLTMHKGTP